MLDGTEAADDMAASAAAFAQQLLASKARAPGQQGTHPQDTAHRQTTRAGGHASSPSRRDASPGLQNEAPTPGSREDSHENRKAGSPSVDDLAAFVIGDSDDDLELLDKDEEWQLLSKFDDTAVDMEALPLVSPPLSPQPDTHTEQKGFSRGKENIVVPTSSASLVHKCTADQGCGPHADPSKALLRRYGGQGGCPGQPGGTQQGRKQLRRLYDSTSMQEQLQQHPSAADGCDALDKEVDPLASSFAGTSQPKEARSDRQAAMHLTWDAERRDSLGYDGLSADDVSPVREPTGSKHAIRRSTASQFDSQRASEAMDKPAQTGWRVLGGLRPDQDSNDSWDSSLPRSSGHNRSASPDTSQHRSCGQVRFLLWLAALSPAGNQDSRHTRPYNICLFAATVGSLALYLYVVKRGLASQGILMMARVWLASCASDASLPSLLGDSAQIGRRHHPCRISR